MPSLRLYFFISVVLLGSVMAIGFSLLSVNYYIDGLDRALSGIMHELSETTEVEDEHPIYVAGFTVASRWQDTPDIIQQRFKTPPTEVGQLQKLKDQSNILLMPQNIYLVVVYENTQGEKRFISKVLLQEDRALNEGTSKARKQLYWALFTALAAIAFFAFMLMMIMRKIAKPIESLKDWAKSLNQNNIQNSPPDFSYNELNVLASLVRSSLISAHQSLDREQRFLSYASHEIRTPIAVIRSNVDLLQRLNEKSPLSEKQQLTLQRIERAGLTLSNLTDTLLWLSRNDDLTVLPEPIKLDEKINQACSDLDYLLNAKNVELKIESEECSVNTVGIACHIVLNNLIRNAYQHTQSGHIHVKQQGSRVTITNSNVSDDAIKPIADPNNNPVTFGCGYGLGLQLSEKIINHHGWFYEVTDAQGSYQVTVDFGRNNEP